MVEGEAVAAAGAEAGGGPLADAVHGEDGGLVEGGREEGRGGVGLVVGGVVERAAPARAQRSVEGGADVELVAEPARHGAHEGPEAARGDGGGGAEDAVELGQRLVVEGDGGQIGGAGAGGFEAPRDGGLGEARVVLDAGEALLLRGGDDLAVAHQRRGAVVVEGRYPQDQRHAGGSSAPGVPRPVHRAPDLARPAPQLCGRGARGPSIAALGRCGDAERVRYSSRGRRGRWRCGRRGAGRRGSRGTARRRCSARRASGSRTPRRRRRGAPAAGCPSSR